MKRLLSSLLKFNSLLSRCLQKLFPGKLLPKRNEIKILQNCDVKSDDKHS